MSPDQRARVMLTQDAKRHGFTLPAEYGTAGPVIVWRLDGECRCRVLRVFLTPEGWHVFGDDFRVHPATWLEWQADDEGNLPTLPGGDALSLDARDEGRVILSGLRKVDGISDVLPLDLAAWPVGVKVIVGCKHGRHRFAPIAWLAEDTQKARETRRRVERRVPVD